MIPFLFNLLPLLSSYSFFLIIFSHNIFSYFSLSVFIFLLLFHFLMCLSIFQKIPIFVYICFSLFFISIVSFPPFFKNYPFKKIILSHPVSYLPPLPPKKKRICIDIFIFIHIILLLLKSFSICFYYIYLFVRIQLGRKKKQINIFFKSWFFFIQEHTHVVRIVTKSLCLKVHDKGKKFCSCILVIGTQVQIFFFLIW